MSSEGTFSLIVHHGMDALTVRPVKFFTGNLISEKLAQNLIDSNSQGFRQVSNLIGFDSMEICPYNKQALNFNCIGSST